MSPEIRYIAAAMREFDIASFALPNCKPGEIRFEEPRDIVRVEFTFSGKPPGRPVIEYLHHCWPEQRVELTGDMDTKRPAHFGVVTLDDHYNSAWTKAATRCERVGKNRMVFSFKPLTQEPADKPGDLSDYDVTFRRTLGLRLKSSNANIKDARVYTRSMASRSTLRVTLDAGKRTDSKQIAFSCYNASVSGIHAGPGVRPKGATVRLSARRDRTFTIDLEHMVPAHRYSYDDALVTLALDKFKFTVSLSALDKEGPIWFAEQGVYITRADDTTTFGEYRARIAGEKTTAAAVVERPEQSLAGARNGQPRPHPVAYIFGCKHARQKFWLEPNGDLVLNAWTTIYQKGGDTARWKNDGDVRIMFGLEKWATEARFNDSWPVPAYNLHFKKEGLRVEQRTFAVPVMTSILDGEPAPDATLASLMRFRFTNIGTAAARATLNMSYMDRSARSFNRRCEVACKAPQTDYLIPLGGEARKISAARGLLTDKYKGASVVRAAYETGMRVKTADAAIEFDRNLAPGETCELILKVLFAAPRAAETTALKALCFDRCDKELYEYWHKECSSSAKIKTRDPNLDALYRGHETSQKICDLGHPDGSGLVNTCVGTSTYGNFPNEASMIVEDLEQRGLHGEARRRIETWIRYQGTKPLAGMFSNQDDVFFGADGIEGGNHYCQHHGWVVWVIARHFFMTGDRKWFAKAIPSMIRGADWVFRERKATLGQQPFSRGWEKGFLPPGGLEDVGDYFYWLSTNTLTWRGTDTAAKALKAFGHPDADRIQKEANAYARDLRRGFETSREYSPLIRLRDGRWVPYYPSRLYRRGRDVGWVRETLEGSVYLLISGLYAPNSQQAKWILDDTLDTRLMGPPFGYPINEPETEWFDCGGFSMQPTLLAVLIPYLDRDEIEVYLWMLFNACAACYREEIQAMVEHPLPVLGFSNEGPFKTSDESNATKWISYLYVYERQGLLHLGRAMPRKWLTDGEAVYAKGIGTTFGSVSVRYESDSGTKTITAQVALKLRSDPESILVRFRHPEKLPIRSVIVNGRRHKAFNPVKGDVDVTGMSGKLKIVAKY